jgi:hypothetical protein
MQEDRKAQAEKVRTEIELLKQQQAGELEREKMRLAEESRRLKEEMNAREKMHMMFLERMEKLRADEANQSKEFNERQLAEIRETREAVNAEMEEKRQFNAELMEMRKQHTEEVIALRKMSDGADRDLETAKIIKDGIVGGLDRIGHRIDLVIGGKKPAGNGNAEPAVRSANPATQVRHNAAHVQQQSTEEEEVLNDKDMKLEVDQPWFQDLKNEVVAVVKKRSNGMKIHGAMLGQVFIDNLNKGKVQMAHLHWLCVRDWEEVLETAKEGITKEEMEVLQTEEGEKWFREFQWFLSESYNASISEAGKQASA